MSGRGGVARVRLPFEPLERYVFLNTNAVKSGGPWNLANEIDTKKMARVVGADQNTVHAWRARGVPFYSADEAAIRLDTHPALIWPEWFDVQRPPPPPREVHGDRAAVAWHRNHDVPMCDPCAELEREINRERMARLRARRAA